MGETLRPCLTWMLTSVLMAVLGRFPAGLSGKALVFPSMTNDSFVTLIPLKPLHLTAFTLCMNVAMEQQCEREVILFAYRTKDFDELNVWREIGGQYSFYLRGEGVKFDKTPLSMLKTQLCATWESITGLSAFWVDGKRSVRKGYKKGHKIQPQGPHGTIILGQDPDSFVGDFEAHQSFVGEISDVNMWDYVLPESQIEALNSSGANGNIIDWDTIQYEIHGNVFLYNSFCQT